MNYQVLVIVGKNTFNQGLLVQNICKLIALILRDQIVKTHGIIMMDGLKTQGVPIIIHICGREPEAILMWLLTQDR